jgi:hypothetical protein
MESITQISEFEAAQNEITVEEIVAYVEKARTSNEQVQASFIEKMTRQGAKEAIRWQGETLIAGELEADLAELVLEAVENGKTGVEAIEIGQRYLQAQIVEGTTSTWSGLMTNEAAKARGKAAYEMQQWGAWSSVMSSGRYRALHKIANRDLAAEMNEANRVVRSAQEKLGRARSEDSKRLLEAKVEDAQGHLADAKAAYNTDLVAKGVPADLLS